jgi:hypothetical protein
MTFILINEKIYFGLKACTDTVVNVLDEHCGIIFHKIKMDSLSSCIFTLIFGELNANSIAYLCHCSYTYQPPRFAPITTAASFFNQISKDVLHLFNEMLADHDEDKPQFINLQNSKMVIVANSKVQPDLIRKGLALMKCPTNNTNQHLQTDESLHLYHQLQRNIKITQPITLILSDNNEDLGKSKSK